MKCEQNGQLSKVSGIADGCANDPNLYCYSRCNRCVCKSTFIATRSIPSSNGIPVECTPKPTPDQLSCPYPFVKVNSPYGQGCYYASSCKRTLHDARKKCQSYGGNLLVVKSVYTTKKILSYLKYLGKRCIVEASYWIGGLETTDIESPKFSDSETKIRRALATMCNRTKIPESFGSIARQFQDKFEGDDDTIGLCLSFYTSQYSAPLRISPIETKKRFICQYTADSNNYAWKDWVDAKTKNPGDKFFYLAYELTSPDKNKVCRAFLDIECRLTNKPNIKIGEGVTKVDGITFYRPLTRLGEHTHLVCLKSANSYKHCPDFQCRMRCPGGNGACTKDSCAEDQVCKALPDGAGHKCEQLDETQPDEPVDYQDFYSKECERDFYYKDRSETKRFRGPRCSFYGDVHMQQFDTCAHNLLNGEKYNSKKYKFDYQGFCTHVAVKCVSDECREPGSVGWWLKVYLWDNGRAGSKVSWTKYVTYEGCGLRVDIRRGKHYARLYVNGTEICGKRFSKECMSCYRSGRYWKCSTSDGLYFGFDGKSRAEARVDRSLQQKVEGLCGNYDGNLTSELALRNGTVPDHKSRRQRMYDIGFQFRVHDDADEAKCEDPIEPPENKSLCDDAVIKAKVEAKCAPIKVVYKNDASHDACIYDFCHNASDICEAIENAYEEYKEDNNGTAPHWLDHAPDFCKPVCDLPNMIFSEYRCMRYCGSDNTCTTTETYWGCHCEENYYWNGQGCVEESECGCTMDDGTLIRPNEVKIKNCIYQYECVQGEVMGLVEAKQTAILDNCDIEECDNNRCTNCKYGRVSAENGTKCVDSKVCPYPFKWIQKKCYAILEPQTWLVAMRKCAQLHDTAHLIRLDETSDVAAFNVFLTQYFDHSTDDELYMWLAGCEHKAIGAAEEGFTIGDIPNSVQQSLKTIVHSGDRKECIGMDINSKLEFYIDGMDPSTLRRPMCVLDPYFPIDVDCLEEMEWLEPLRTDEGAKLSLEDIYGYKSLRPDLGHKLCQNPRKLRCYLNGEERSYGIVCSAKHGFICRDGPECMDYRISVCCHESVDNCEKFPNACDKDLERCEEGYYYHTCKCKEGMTRAADGMCVPDTSLCKCDCTHERCRNCRGVKYLNKDDCSHTVFSNDCAGRNTTGPVVTVNILNKKCGQSTCVDHAYVKVCQDSARLNDNDCYAATLSSNSDNCMKVRTPLNNWGSDFAVLRVDNQCVFKASSAGIINLKVGENRWSGEFDRRKFFDKMCGLCGDWSYGDITFTRQDGTDFGFEVNKSPQRRQDELVYIRYLDHDDSEEYVQDWRVQADNCSTKPPSSVPACTDAEKMTVKTNKRCSFINVLGSYFNDTAESIQDMLNLCAELSCHDPLGEPNCNLFEEYVESFANDVPWRNLQQSPCKVDCLTPNLIPFYGNDREFCYGDPESGYECVCDLGFLYDSYQDACVRSQDCYCYISPDVFLQPGRKYYDTSDCTKVYECVNRQVIVDRSDASVNAVCNEDGPTGCIDGFDGDGKTCVENYQNCTAGWQRTTEGCAKIFRTPLDFRLAAEKCRKEGADLIGVADDAYLDEIVDLLQNEAIGTMYYIAGMCHNEGTADAVQDGSVPGADSYIRPNGSTCDSSGKSTCFIATKQSNTVEISQGTCRSPRKFICRKKKDDEYEWTDYCDSDDFVPPGSEKETRESMLAANCTVCNKPRRVECRRMSDNRLSADIGGTICDVNNIFVGEYCEENCDDYEVRMFCMKLIDECAKGIDLCRDDERCKDTLYSYNCQCKNLTDKLITVNGETTCEGMRTCKMTPITNGINLTPFGETNPITFNGHCKFRLVSTMNCSSSSQGTGRTDIEVLYMTEASASETVYVEFIVDGTHVKISADGTISTGEVGLDDARPFFVILETNQISFGTDDNAISCTAAFNMDRFTSVACEATRFYDPSCGVCTLGDTDVSTEENLIQFFDDNSVTEGSCKEINDTLDGDCFSNIQLDIANILSCDLLAARNALSAFGIDCDMMCDTVDDIIETMRTSSLAPSCGPVQVIEEQLRNTSGCDAPDSTDPVCGTNQRPANDGEQSSRCSVIDAPVPVISQCVCVMGFVLEGTNCIDENDCGCTEDSDIRNSNETVPTGIGYVKKNDNVPFTCGSKLVCVSRDVFELQQYPCVQNADCVNDTCVCRENHRGDGYVECSEEIDEPDRVCWRSASTNEMTCECKMGYASACGDCVDINECSQVNICPPGMRCKNTNGGYECECRDGFHKVGNTCEDIEECNDPDDACPDTNDGCVELNGSYACLCCPGYVRTARNQNCSLIEDVPPNNDCKLCLHPLCYGNPDGENDVICYRKGGAQIQFSSYRTFFFWLNFYADSPQYSDDDISFTKCPNTTSFWYQTHPNGLPKESDVEVVEPCSDEAVCIITPTVNDKLSGRGCYVERMHDYPNLCEFKKDLCRLSVDNTVPPLELGKWRLGQCGPGSGGGQPITVVLYAQWTPWTTCVASSCVEDAGRQHRSRIVLRKPPGYNGTLKTEDEQSCTKQGCPSATTDEPRTPYCVSLKCSEEGEELPVCGSLNGGPLFTFLNECEIKTYACATTPTSTFHIKYHKRCLEEGEEPPKHHKCGGAPENRTVTFEKRINDLDCKFDNVSLITCEYMYCVDTNDEGVTSTDVCCQNVGSTGQEQTVMGRCKNDEEVEYTVGVPASCECKDTSG